MTCAADTEHLQQISRKSDLYVQEITTSLTKEQTNNHRTNEWTNRPTNKYAPSQYLPAQLITINKWKTIIDFVAHYHITWFWHIVCVVTSNEHSHSKLFKLYIIQLTLGSNEVTEQFISTIHTSPLGSWTESVFEHSCQFPLDKKL